MGRRIPCKSSRIINFSPDSPAPIDLDHALDQCQQHPAFRFLDLPERGDQPKAVLQAAEYLGLRSGWIRNYVLDLTAHTDIFVIFHYLPNFFQVCLRSDALRLKKPP